MKHGIVHWPQRKEHKFTVWYNGEVIKFCSTRAEAEQVLRLEEWRQAQVAHH